ncbi:hypothetical protein AYO40_04055 [Planctomycetaceae bacterium SCGC AG-212-D15]|nr:hypothetical protein AYO40_04055 [Planctomycetaceae bacterium SCGC AG-212-D15]
MWPSIRRLRDWAMHDLWNLMRGGPQLQALHYSFEKAGLTLLDQPVPWNAEAVVVEAQVHLPTGVPRRRCDFSLHLPGREPIPADGFRSRGAEDRARLHFRFAPPTRSLAAEVHWRERRLGMLTLPILSMEEFLANLRLQRPTLFVRLGDQTVPCQTFVSAQCRGLLASAILVSPTSLVPLLDLGLRVEFVPDRGAAQVAPAQLCSSQLADRQAMVAVIPRRYPRRGGEWTANWMVADRPLASQRVRAISRRNFERSLRVSDTRFVLQSAKGEVKLARQLPPLDEVHRAGPCFLVSSKEPGMAGMCILQTRAQVNHSSQAPQLEEQEVLVTDGPALVAPGTLAAADLAKIAAFELKIKKESLGLLPMSPVPAATFTGEGGFKPATEFSWSVSADDELNERLTRLIDGRGKEE